jgi:uncharacterized SAM-binding protein YcdF (DUF218 family)
VRRAVRFAGGILAAVAVVAAGGLAAFGTAVSDFATPTERHADGIVVLTGGEARLAEASRLFVAGKARRLLISGVNRQTSRDDIRRLSSIPPQLFDCCVDIGYEALDTIGNAVETRTWATTWRFTQLIVVTSDYHMPRSLTEFSRAMPEVRFEPYSVASRGFKPDQWWQHPASARRVVTEYIKFLPAAARLAKARVQDRIEQVILARAGDVTNGAALSAEPVLGDTPKIR